MYRLHRALATILAVGLLAAPLRGAERPDTGAKPNVLLIICDQMHAGMLSAAGNRWVKTPALDALAAGGVRFERAYCANPVCVPSRFSMMTGVMPSRIGMESNDGAKNPVPPAVMDHALGRVFARAGYETAYGGKVHLPQAAEGAGNPVEGYGFQRYLTADRKDDLVGKCAQYLGGPHQRPFLLVASFINPHDICYMAIAAHQRSQGGAGEVPDDLTNAMAIPAGVSREDFFARLCPPLPPNFEVPEGEPDALLSAGGRTFRHFVRQGWTEQDWRLHRWAYARLTESVDAQIGLLLRALADAGLDQNTLVAFVSDHGDMDGAHRLEHKSVPYEEAVRVPFVVRLPGTIPAGLVDREHLVSTGLDLIPSLCDLAGQRPPAALKGRSVRPLLAGRPVRDWRQALVVEVRNARVAHQGSWKYVVYGSGRRRELVVDLRDDPGEMRNLAALPAGGGRAEAGRRLLRDWYPANGEQLDPRYVVHGP